MSLKGCALIRGREGASGQTDRATWKPAVHTPAASEMGSISTLRTSQWNKTAQEKSTAACKENTVHAEWSLNSNLLVFTKCTQSLHFSVFCTEVWTFFSMRFHWYILPVFIFCHFGFVCNTVFIISAQMIL